MHIQMKSDFVDTTSNASLVIFKSPEGQKVSLIEMLMTLFLRFNEFLMYFFSNNNTSLRKLTIF